MKREIVVADDTGSMIYVVSLLDQGYVLDPTLTSGKPYLLEASTVWPLVLYENDGEKPKIEAKAGEFDNVVDVAETPHDRVSDKIKEGYVVHAIYAKSTILVKREKQ